MFTLADLVVSWKNSLLSNAVGKCIFSDFLAIRTDGMGVTIVELAVGGNKQKVFTNRYMIEYASNWFPQCNHSIAEFR